MPADDILRRIEVNVASARSLLEAGDPDGVIACLSEITDDLDEARTIIEED